VKRGLFLATAFLILSCSSTDVRAGGDEWWVTVTRVSRSGLVDGSVQLASATREPLLGDCRSLLVKVDYRWSKWMLRFKSPVTYSGHRAAFAALADAAVSKKPILAGVIGGAFVAEHIRVCEVPSAGLAVGRDEAGALHLSSYHD
jgi:hypothetical protein